MNSENMRMEEIIERNANSRSGSMAQLVEWFGWAKLWV